MKSPKNLSLLLLLLVLVGAGCSSKPEPTAQVQEPAEEVVVKGQPQEYDLSTVDYKIVKSEDFSIPSANRFNVRVLMSNNPTTEEQIKAVSEKIVQDYQEKADAVSILFYFEESQIDGAYTLAKADWAPNGDWSQADLKTNQKLVYDFKDIVGQERSDGPTAEEREINQAMKDLWYEMVDQTDDLVTDEDVAKILAPQYGKTVNEMLEIRMKVTNYDLGL